MRTGDPVTTEAELAAAPRGVTICRAVPGGGRRVIRVTVAPAGVRDGQRWWTIVGLTLQPGDAIAVHTAPADTRFTGFDEWGVYQPPTPPGDAA